MLSTSAPPDPAATRAARHRRPRRRSTALLGLVLLFGGEACHRPADSHRVSAGATAVRPSTCAPGTRCLAVDADGTPNPAGTSVAQCSGTFPDFVVEAGLFPTGFEGPWFYLAQRFPAEPTAAGAPWLEIDFTNGQDGANAYLYTLRDYAYEGNLETDFRVQENPVRSWYTVPLMNYGPGRREMIHGLTRERSLTAPELGIRPGVTVHNYAIGFYNAQGGYTLGQVWSDPTEPALEASRFAVGTMVFKILFSDAVPEDFEKPEDDPLEGAPAWQIATGNGELTTVRLLQMDLAARDDRAPETGWVFGTFAYDRAAPDADPWLRMRPVGLAWGNDPGYTPQQQQQGVPLAAAAVSDQIPAYAAGHLGWAGRVNGPVDNPISACVSCHMTAQFPVDAPMAPSMSSCTTDDQKLWWFRDLAGDDAFGGVDDATCAPSVPPIQPPISLDYSLQMQVAVQNALQYRDTNPCIDAPPRPERADRRVGRAPRVGRGGFLGE